VSRNGVDARKNTAIGFDANRIPVVVDKKAEDQGRYLHPELFGGEPIT
jgi:hypothetical protein